MLEKIDEEIEALLDALTSLIEPLLIVFLGVIVGGIVIAMFLPIFKLNEVVSQSKSQGEACSTERGGGSQGPPSFFPSPARARNRARARLGRPCF